MSQPTLDLDRAAELFPAESSASSAPSPRTVRPAAEPTVFTIVPAGPPKPYPTAPKPRARPRGVVGGVARLMAPLGRAVRATVMAPIQLMRRLAAATVRLGRSVKP